MSFTRKLFIILLSFSLLPLIASSCFIFFKSMDSLEKEVMTKIQVERNSKRKAIVDYFGLISQQVLNLSKNDLTKNALKAFKIGFDKIDSEMLTSQLKADSTNEELKKFYLQTFIPQYEKVNEGKSTSIDQIFAMLDQKTKWLQYGYISSNMNPLGSKHLLNRSILFTDYDRSHDLYHHNFRDFLERFGFYDIFLVDAQNQNLLYSVYKELDFATSLKDGPYKSTGLAEVVRKSLEAKDKNEVFFADYQLYFPSYDNPASFIGTPIWDGDVIIGALVFQISFDRINSVMQVNHSDNESLETYIVGDDFKMRSDTKADVKNRNVISSFKNPEAGSIKSQAIIQAFKGVETVELGQDFLKRNVFAATGPIEIFGKKWAIETIILYDEAAKSLSQIKWTLLIFIISVIIIISGTAFYFSKSISKSLNEISSGLADAVNQLVGAAREVKEVSHQLSEASSESSASIQETAASVEELSSIVKLNSDNAKEANSVSMQSYVSAEAGEKDISSLIKAMAELAKSSREIEEITNVIDDIASQTNLLALNASVEAARAGEQGKGFAVVANEVSSLAKRSANAAKEINSLIKENVRKTTEGADMANTSANSLKGILHSVKKVSDLNAEVSAATIEQANGLEQISKAMNHLDTAIQSNVNSSHVISNSSESLTSQAENIEKLILAMKTFVDGHKN